MVVEHMFHTGHTAARNLVQLPSAFMLRVLLLGNAMSLVGVFKVNGVNPRPEPPYSESFDPKVFLD